ncbi:MAG: dihydroorotate dehydrogenase electron transfer subunit [Candidatus Omnitrophica bacterium]|nr:dihydroorotate dehydrogenase electron transfer subunit [Candidatus Omnitrophota bacterium]
MMMHQGNFKIISNEKTAGGCFRLRVMAPEAAEEARPGQFVHLRVQQEIDKPFLRRPFAVCDVKDNGVLEILYKVRGRGTSLLSEKKEGGLLDVIGPLGNGFDCNVEPKRALVVAGGIGIAPLIFLSRKLLDAGREVVFMRGAVTAGDVLCCRELKNMKLKVITATEDGSGGIKSKITEVLENYLRKEKDKEMEIFAAGPRPMLRVVARLSGEYKIESQVSMDEMMACGVGVCLGCAVMTRNGYKLACKDGPVFKAGDIIWE